MVILGNSITRSKLKGNIVSLKEELIPVVLKIRDLALNRDEKLFKVCKLLSEKVDVFDWVGFYLADPTGKEELILGPYIGAPTDHIRIPYGRGICGQVALSHQTFVSQDVHSEDNYLACSLEVQSEIVVPIMKEDAFVAQLDIDSNTKNAISAEHKELCEAVCELLTVEF